MIERLLSKPVVGFTLAGSSLYGLEVEGSDRDIVVVTGGNEKETYHHVSKEDDEDIRILSVDTFLRQVDKGDTVSTDILSSRNFRKSLEDSPYGPMLASYRSDLRFVARENLRFSLQHVAISYRRTDSGHEKNLKPIKLALRQMTIRKNSFEKDSVIIPSSMRR